MAVYVPCLSLVKFDHEKYSHFVSVWDNHLKLNSDMEDIYAHILTEFQRNGPRSFRAITAGRSLFLLNITIVKALESSDDHFQPYSVKYIHGWWQLYRHSGNLCPLIKPGKVWLLNFVISSINIVVEQRFPRQSTFKLYYWHLNIPTLVMTFTLRCSCLW